MQLLASDRIFTMCLDLSTYFGEACWTGMTFKGRLKSSATVTLSLKWPTQKFITSNTLENVERLGTSDGKKNFDDAFSHFDTMQECHGRTDRQTDRRNELSHRVLIHEWMRTHDKNYQTLYTATHRYNKWSCVTLIPLVRIVAIYVHLWSIMCQTGLSRHL